MKKDERTNLLTTLENRFAQNMHRHKGVAWNEIRERLTTNGKTLAALAAMEATGGEPDVIRYDKGGCEDV